MLQLPRPLIWLVDSLNTMRGFPEQVQKKLGFALYQAQIGERHETASLMHGFDATVWEVRAQDPSGAYRAMYVVSLGAEIYVLHAFQKKSKSGISTPQREIELIRRRLQMAQALAGRTRR